MGHEVDTNTHVEKQNLPFHCFFFFSKRLMEEQDMNEEVFEKRFELLTNSVRKMRRRRPCTEIFEDKENDAEWVSSVLLHREQVKIKVCAKSNIIF